MFRVGMSCFGKACRVKGRHDVFREGMSCLGKA